MKKSIFSSPPPQLNGQLGSLRAFLAEDWPGEGDGRESENTSAMLEVIHLPLLRLSYLSLSSGNFHTASSPQDSHETTLQSASDPTSSSSRRRQNLT